MVDSDGAHHPESILFVLDEGEEGQGEAYKGYTKLQALQQCVALCASTKSKLSKAHRFALATLSAKAELVQPFSSSVDALLSAVKACRPSRAPLPAPELGSLVELAQRLAQQEAALGSRLRAVLLYSRSSAVPSWRGGTLAGLALDALFIHDKPEPGVNDPQVGAAAPAGRCAGRRPAPTPPLLAPAAEPLPHHRATRPSRQLHAPTARPLPAGRVQLPGGCAGPDGQKGRPQGLHLRVLHRQLAQAAGPDAAGAPRGRRGSALSSALGAALGRRAARAGPAALCGRGSSRPAPGRCTVPPAWAAQRTRPDACPCPSSAQRPSKPPPPTTPTQHPLPPRRRSWPTPHSGYLRRRYSRLWTWPPRRPGCSRRARV
jgi:hypothetical protein